MSAEPLHIYREMTIPEASRLTGIPRAHLVHAIEGGALAYRLCAGGRTGKYRVTLLQIEKWRTQSAGRCRLLSAKELQARSAARMSL